MRRAGPLAVQDGTRLLREVAWALAYAHEHGVVQRDVKPDNVLMEFGTGRALVTDFGIARLTASALTQVGESIGTPQYMSPEQAAGESVDGRSDLYSLGAVGYFAVTRRPPFDAAASTAILAMHLTQPVPPLAGARGDVPDALAVVVERLLAKEPAARFQRGNEVVEAPDAMRATHPEVAPPIREFRQKTGLMWRGALLIAFITWLLLRTSRYDGDRLGLVVMAVGAGTAMGEQLLVALRALARRGFRFEDVRRGLVAIEVEQREARGPLHVRRPLLLVALLVVDIALYIFARSHRIPIGGGVYNYSRATGVRTVCSSVMFVKRSDCHRASPGWSVVAAAIPVIAR